MNTPTQHTPGPWKAEGWENITVNAASGITITTAAGSANCPLSELKANAALIAAAPDLLEACKLIQAAFAHCTPFEHGDAAEKALDAVDAVINKASTRATE